MTKENQKNLMTRPPVVVVMGHIDHGKTTLLDQIRKARVAEKESGGITQHVGAYQVDLSSGSKEPAKKITFLDTPGHEAFFQMRSRGAKLADIALLVVDASEGLKNQTKEVIQHIKKAEIIPIVVLNKMDRPEADPNKVKRELAQEGILVESIGGEIPSVEVSAKTGKGVNDLLDLILLVSEMEKLTADFEKPGEGIIIESYQDSLRGPTATLLLTDGSIKVGEWVATGSGLAKIKSLEDFNGNSIKQAFPSDPVIVFGFDQVPKVGEEFKVFSQSLDAENYSKSFISVAQVKAPVTQEEGKKTINIILKADVTGSSEAIEGILNNLPQDNVVLKIIRSEVGNINESDLQLARGSQAIILAFRVKADSIAKKILERERIRILSFEIIYELVEDLRKLMDKFIEPEEVRTDLGRIKVLAVFLNDKNRQIVGGKVIEGEIKKGSLIEVFRSEEKIGQGKMVNLQKDKKDANSASKGQECGILFEGSGRIEEGDFLVIYVKEKKK